MTCHLMNSENFACNVGEKNMALLSLIWKVSQTTGDIAKVLMNFYNYIKPAHEYKIS